jgi:hypothetical protein
MRWLGSLCIDLFCMVSWWRPVVKMYLNGVHVRERVAEEETFHRLVERVHAAFL